VGRFLRGQPSSAPIVAHLLTDGARLSALSSPKAHLLRARVSSPVTHHHPVPQGWPRVLLPPRAIASAAVRRGIPSPLPPASALVAATGRHDAGAKHPVTRSRTAPLLPPPMLALRLAPSSPPAT
jgi:hypothetical protein